ncbi:MAG: hypothetical protein OEN21_11085 [Myxococcales bacterium]|nr:hypothetical protein [Myxococcales bacterium]
MDLTRLYNLTTPELREEAERLGVEDTYAMSRGQLIHAIRNRAGGQESEGLLGKVLGFAKWALKAAQEEPRKKPGQGEAKRFGRPAEAPLPSVGRKSEPVPVPAPAPVPVPAPAPTSATDPEVESTTRTDSEPELEAACGPPSRPPVGVFSKTASMFDEPFPTLTMARILADQGHFKRSLAIYATLLREEPGNRELSAEADGIRAQSRARRPQIH